MDDIGTIRVGNKRKWSEFQPEPGEVVVHIDRPNLLCNPFPVNDRTCRATAIAAFMIDFEAEIKRRNGKRYDEVCRIVETLLHGKDVILMCWCKPLNCHGDVIQSVVERLLQPPVVQKPVRRREW